ncbi:MAG: peptide deformylase [Rickettsiales bacterium]|nr:peptide deformylase [Rickettsiales bacterium]
MTTLRLIYGPDPIFKQTAAPVNAFDDALRATTEAMCKVMYSEKAVGLGANMVGLLQRIIVVDLQIQAERAPMVMVNPVIEARSEAVQRFEEGSISFPFISAEIERPAEIRLTYQDINGNTQPMQAEGWLATVIQHEIDYLDGVVFLDYLSKTKRDMLLRRMQKQMRAHGIR